MRVAVTCGLIAILSAFSVGQKKTLDAFVKEQKAALAGDFPLYYLDGTRTSKVFTLDGFNRKVTKIGSLKAIVPINMVAIDDSFTQKPNLYDGLDESSKVLYFVSILDERQIKIASGPGIGFGDLNADQKLVLNSIIPKKLNVERREVGETEFKVVDKFSVEGNDRTKVRFKLTKSVTLELPLAEGNDGSRGYCPANSMDHLGLAKTPGFYRVQDFQESGPDELYGVKIRSVVPNKLKPSDLDYSSANLSALIKFNEPTTISDALKQVRVSTGFSIHADPRVANRKITLIGPSIKVGELLQAIAESVTGTYRRVGPDFVLTSDLNGLGTRKLKFSQWEADIQKSVDNMKPEWYAKIGKNSAMKYAKASSSDPIQPDIRMEEFLAKSDGNGEKPSLPNDLLDSGLRGIVERFNAMYKTQQVSLKGIKAYNNLRFSLLMPTGQEILDSGGSEFCPFVMVNQEINRKPRRDDPTLPPLRKIPDTLTAGLVLRLYEKAQAEKFVPMANTYGFKEVWIETESLEVLTRAIEVAKPINVSVRLAIRPWLNHDPNQDSDRTLMGDTGAAVRNWVPSSERLSPKIMGYDYMRKRVMPEDCVSPDNQPARWAGLQKLTIVPDLKGIVVLDAQPAGYEPKTGEGYSYLQSPSEMAPMAFGYSTSMRLQFLRKVGVDPIDLVPKNLFSTVNVNPFFFQDMELMGMPRTYGSVEGEEFIIDPFSNQWDTFRRATMADGLKRLSTGLLDGAKVPVWCDLLVGGSNKYTSMFIPMPTYTPELGFSFDQSGPGMPFGAQSTPTSSRVVLDGLTDDTIQKMLGMMSMTLKQNTRLTFAFDLSLKKDSEVENFLTKWFDPKG